MHILGENLRSSFRRTFGTSTLSTQFSSQTALFSKGPYAFRTLLFAKTF